MIKLYSLSAAPFENDGLFERCLAFVGEERRAKVCSLAARQDRNRSLAAGVLLRLALADFCGEESYSLRCNAHGKPFFASPQGVYFNLSHSGDKALAAFSLREVGCDIQQVRVVPASLAARFFSEEENAYLSSLPPDRANDAFFRLWTVKESYVKALGVGLSRPLSSFTVRLRADGAEIADASCTTPFSVREYGGTVGYRAACCGTEEFADGVVWFDDAVLGKAGR